MTEKAKKYCRDCGERVRHRDTRCPYCRRRIVTGRLVFIYLLMAVFIVTAFFLWLDYSNIEFFK